MHLLKFNKISLAHGSQVLFSEADFQISSGERVCLIGRNGAGKSTLMKVATGAVLPDDGDIWRKKSLKMAILEQDLPVADNETVYNVIASGLSQTGQLLKEWHELSLKEHSAQTMTRLETVQEQLENANGWQFHHKIEQMLERFGLNGNALMATLSGGEKRRVELARALVGEPELLFLDEPTNHMDIATIGWLEKHLKAFSGALLFITHDRSFLRSLATRIVELDRTILTSWNCDYDTFLERKAHALAVEERQNALFDKKLQKEEAWIRQGIKARRTRNEGRVRALKALREERQARIKQIGKAKLAIEKSEISGKLVTELSGISHSYENRLLIDSMDYSLLRGDKVGLIGANGAGKSTLLKILLEEIKPDKGSVRQGTRLEVAYFDQMREQLDPEKTVIDNVAGGRERIKINGKEKHIISYLEDFLFSPARARTPVKVLSGGERNRLLLARLFSKPANLLVMDEPTNDLDLETLELLESLLVNFSGTLLLVSHDREFLDNVVSSVLVFEGEGKISEYTGGFSDWLAQGGSTDIWSKTDTPKSSSTTSTKSKAQNYKEESALPQTQKKKLSYKLQRELDSLPKEIEQLEQQIEEVEKETASADFYQQTMDIVQSKLKTLEQLNNTLAEKMNRWLELEEGGS